MVNAVLLTTKFEERISDKKKNNFDIYLSTLTTHHKSSNKIQASDHRTESFIDRFYLIDYSFDDVKLTGPEQDYYDQVID